MQPIPIEIGRAGWHDVRVAWSDGHVSIYRARPLRLMCPCAACVEETTGRSLLDPDSVPRHVQPLKIEPVGRYGVQITWSDRHATGIYTYEFLRRTCPCSECAGGERT